MSNHTAVILIALGGPRSIDEVGPFMTALMGRPAPAPLVQAITERYNLIGGSSPLPEIVAAQAHELGKMLGPGYRAYHGFRYSAPHIDEAVLRAVSEGADRVIGLSMSPYETTVTTGLYRSAFDAVKL